jgi:hypothetical protein
VTSPHVMACARAHLRAQRAGALSRLRRSGQPHKTHRLEIVHRLRKCLHFYFYFLDPEFGFMHVRLQSWLPFTIQIYIKGHEWLCRQLDRRGIGYRRNR